MEFHTLTSTFLKDIVIDEFESGIWTERYTQPGDVRLVLPATRERVKQLAEGNFLSLKGSKEVMLIDTQLIEDNMLTVTGNTLDKFLEERYVDGYLPIDFYGSNKDFLANKSIRHLTGTPSLLIFQILEETLLSRSMPNYFSGPANEDVIQGYTPYFVDSKLSITNLHAGALYDDSTSPTISVTLTTGTPLHKVLLDIAELYVLGMSLYLESANDYTYTLRFTTYKGKDRTRDQTENELLRFSPELDSFTNIKELRSIAGFKTRVVVNLPNGLTAPNMGPVSAVAFEINRGVNPTQKGQFDSRQGFITTKRVTDAMIKKALGQYVGVPPPSGVTANQSYFDGNLAEKARIKKIMEEEARDFLTQNRRKRSIDGETVPRDNYRFGKDYGLGDIVEVEGYTGRIEKVRVTEYIRIQDATGERAYPTLSPLTLTPRAGYLSDE